MPTVLDPNQVFARNSGFVARKIAGELILIPVQKELREVNCIYSLNTTGAALWDLVDGKRTLADIRSQILETYDVTAEKLDSDLEDVLTQLEEIKAIQKP